MENEYNIFNKKEKKFPKIPQNLKTQFFKKQKPNIDGESLKFPGSKTM
jgi:hypothetical protein